MNRFLIAVLTGIMLLTVSAIAQGQPEERLAQRDKMLAFRESLTGEQTRQMRNIKQEWEKKAVRLRADMQVANIELRQLLEDESASESRIRGQLETIASFEVDLKMGRIALRKNMKAVLTQEQLENLPKSGLRPYSGRMGRQGGKEMRPGRRMNGNGQPGLRGKLRGSHGNSPGGNRNFDVRIRLNREDASVEESAGVDEDIFWNGQADYGEMDQDLFDELISEEIDVMPEGPKQP